MPPGPDDARPLRPDDEEERFFTEVGPPRSVPALSGPRQPRPRADRLLLVGIVVGILAVVGVVVLLDNLSDASRPSIRVEAVNPEPVEVRSLADGDCLRGIPATTSTPVLRVDCSRPHDARVVGRTPLPGNTSGGGPAAVEDAKQACASAFTTEHSADLDAWWAAVPSAQDYAAGERTVVCAAPA